MQLQQVIVWSENQLHWGKQIKATHRNVARLPQNTRQILKNIAIQNYSI